MNTAAIVLFLTTLLMAGCNTPMTKPEIPVPTADGSASSAPTAAAILTKEEAQTIALQHAGLAADQVTGIRTEFEFDDGLPHYDVQFRQGQLVYDYEIHAETGTILSYETEQQ